jgi:hypothetical protein
LEEIGPVGGRADDSMGGEVELDVPSGGIDRGPVVPVYVQAADPWAPAFGAAALAAAIVSLFGIFALICGVLGTWPDTLKWFDAYKDKQAWMVIVIGVVLTAIFFVAGALVGKASGGTTR